VKFVLFVEGYTERKAIPSFLKRWLDPQLSQSVGIQPVRFEGWSEFRKKIARSASMHLNSPDSEQIIGAIGLLDLYGPDFFPEHISSTRDRHDWAVAHFQAEVGHPKFRMFFAVHEIEAWILSQPQLLPASIRHGLPGRSAQPELVNFNGEFRVCSGMTGTSEGGMRQFRGCKTMNFIGAFSESRLPGMWKRWS
jgi:hypothetical protein